MAGIAGIERDALEIEVGVISIRDRISRSLRDCDPPGGLSAGAQVAPGVEDLPSARIGDALQQVDGIAADRLLGVDQVRPVAVAVVDVVALAL
jgi:hypothetical protein